MSGEAWRPRPERRTRGGSGVGKRIGPYTLIRYLGRGTSGVVYLARRDGLARDFALKILFSQDVPGEEALSRFRLEAQVASKLEESGVIGVFDIGQDRGRHYFAMEYVAGPTLEQRLQQGPMAPREAAELLAQLAHTVHAAHLQNVIHRDLKPANVIIDERRGRARITDFGLAQDRTLVRSLTRSGDVLGTPYYMPPEVLQGEARVDALVDVYALGVILYECLTGRRPYKAKNVAELVKVLRRSRPKPLRALNPSVPAPLEAICARAMARRRVLRYPGAELLAEDLERFLNGQMPKAVSDRTPELDLPAEEERSGAWRLLAAVCLVLVLGLGLYLAEREGLLVEWGLRPRPAAPSPADRPPPASPAEPDTPRRQLASALARAANLAPVDSVLAALDAAEQAGVEAGDGSAREIRLARLEVTLRRGRVAEALRQAEELNGAFSGTEELRRRWALGRALEELGRREEAKQAYESLELLDPRGAAGLTAAAAASRLIDQQQEAFDLASRAISRDTDFVPALIELARALPHKRGEPAVARKPLRNALELAPDSVWVHLLLAGVERALGDERAALEALDQAVALGEPSPLLAARLERAETQLALQDPAAALGDLDSFLEDRPQDLGALFLRGEAARRLGEAERMRRDWSMIYDTDPARLRALAEARGEEAVGRVTRLLRLGPDGSRGSVPLLVVSEPLERRLADRAQELGGQRLAPSLGQALVRAAAGYPWELLAPGFAELRRQAPRDPHLLLLTATVQLGRDELQLGLETLAEAKRQAADPAQVGRLRGVAYWRGGQPERARQEWEEVAQRDLKGAEGLHCRAQARFLDGRLDEARALVERALEVDREHAPSLLLRGLLLRRLGAERLEIEQAWERLLARQGLLDGHVQLLAIERHLARLPQARDPLPALPPGHPALPDLIEAHDDQLWLSSGAAPRVLCAALALGTDSLSWRRRGQAALAAAVRRDPDHPELLVLRGVYALANPDASEDDVLTRWAEAKARRPAWFLAPVWAERFRKRFGSAEKLYELGLVAR